MMTQSHIAIGLLVAGRPGRKAAITGALIGGIVPDFFMVPMILISRFVLGQDMGTIWDETYYSAPWWTLDQIANSAPLYAVVLVLGLTAGRRLGSAWWPRFLTALSLSALLHVVLDFFTHASDGHCHFWPLSDFVFNSPVSYWEGAHFGRPFGILEALSGLVAAPILWRLYRGWVVRTFSGILLLLSVLGLVFCLLLIFGFWTEPG